MFGRKIPKPAAQPSGEPPTPADSDRTTSYRTGQDTAPSTAAPKTTSYVNAMQLNIRGFETIN